jgi:hypothetical protein
VGILLPAIHQIKHLAMLNVNKIVKPKFDDSVITSQYNKFKSVKAFSVLSKCFAKDILVAGS